MCFVQHVIALCLVFVTSATAVSLLRANEKVAHDLPKWKSYEDSGKKEFFQKCQDLIELKKNGMDWKDKLKKSMQDLSTELTKKGLPAALVPGKIKWDLLSEGAEDTSDAVAKAKLNLEILSDTVLSVWKMNGMSIGVKNEYELTYIVCDDTEECRNSPTGYKDRLQIIQKLKNTGATLAEKYKGVIVYMETTPAGLWDLKHEAMHVLTPDAPIHEIQMSLNEGLTNYFAGQVANVDTVVNLNAYIYATHFFKQFCNSNPTFSKFCYQPYFDQYDYSLDKTTFRTSMVQIKNKIAEVISAHWTGAGTDWGAKTDFTKNYEKVLEMVNRLIPTVESVIYPRGRTCPMNIMMYTDAELIKENAIATGQSLFEGAPFPRNIVVTGPYIYDKTTNAVQINMRLRTELIEKKKLYREGRVQDDFCRVWKCFFTSITASWFERQWCRAPSEDAGPWHLKNQFKFTSQKWLDAHHPDRVWFKEDQEGADVQHLKANKVVEPPPAVFLPTDTRSVHEHLGESNFGVVLKHTHGHSNLYKRMQKECQTCCITQMSILDSELKCTERIKNLYSSSEDDADYGFEDFHCGCKDHVRSKIALKSL